MELADSKNTLLLQALDNHKNHQTMFKNISTYPVQPLSIAPFTHKNIKIVWNQVDTVNSIIYKGTHVSNSIISTIPLVKFQQGRVDLPGELITIIEDVLNGIAALPKSEQRKKIHSADRLFESLHMDTNPPNPAFRRAAWLAILQVVWAWESKNEKVHKGTPFYFMGESCLRSGDIPSAYICFFNGLEEDKRNFPFIPKNLKDAPAYMTTSLVDNENNNQYQEEVLPLRDRLNKSVKDYVAEVQKVNARVTPKFELKDFDSKFLQNDNVEDIKRFFVASYRELIQLEPFHSKAMIANDYSKLKVVDSFFNIALVIDQLLTLKFGPSMSRRDMANAIFELFKHHWPSKVSVTNAGDFTDLVHPAIKHVAPDAALQPIIDGHTTFDGNTLNPLEAAIFAAYYIRNFGAHKIEASCVMVERYDEILRLLLFALFFAVHTL